MTVEKTIDAARSRTAARAVRILSACILGLYLGVAAIVAINTHHALDPAGSPIGYDFTTFYTAAQFARDGRAADAYDDAVTIEAERALIPGNRTRLPWNYPPIFQFLLLPFAFLPYIAAWIAWSAAIYGAYIVWARRISAPPWLWLALLFPGAAINLLLGQNGLLSLVLLGGAAAMLDRRPLAAGVLFGLMSYKPHLAILVPFALLFGREWRALAAMAVTGIGLTLFSAAAFGWAPWAAFLDRAAHAGAVFQSSSSDWHNIPSVMILARTLGVDDTIATALHWAVAALASVAVLLVWRTRANTPMKAAALGVGALIVTPYLRSYDLTLLMLPAIALAGGNGRLAYATHTLIALAWLLPGLVLFSDLAARLAPIVFVVLLGLIVQRSLGSGASSATWRQIRMAN